MKPVIALLCLLSVSGASGQSATFSTETLRLEIPHLIVNRTAAFEDVELLFDASRDSFELVDYSKRSVELSEQRMFVLGFGESAVIDENFTITFRGIFSDNRCPSDVTCITGGEGVGLFVLNETLDSGLTRQTLFGLTFTGLDNGIADKETPAHEFRGLYFTPLVLEPYPVSTQTIADEDYSVTILVAAITSSCFPDSC